MYWFVAPGNSRSAAGYGHVATIQIRAPCARTRFPVPISNLFARPLRRALVEKGIQPFAEVATHVAHEDEVFAFLPREPALQPRQRLLGSAQRQGCVAGDK